MSLLYAAKRWTIRHPGAEGERYVAIDPDGKEHESYDDYAEAWEAIAPLNNKLHDQEVDARGADLAELLIELKQRGVSEVSVEYNGCGDEGRFEDVVVVGGEASAAEISAIEDYFDFMLESRYAGWENNDGAEGTFSIDLAVPVMKVKHVHNECYIAHDTTEHENDLPRPAHEGESSRAGEEG